jgi:tetratricopeptide (TPR) repeat protein
MANSVQDAVVPPEKSIAGNDSAAPTSDFMIHLFAVLLIVGLGTLVYSHTLRYPFAFDDVPNITDNSHIRMEQFSVDGLRKAGFESPIKGRPLAYFTLAINYWWGGYDIVGYHVVNIAIHVINGLLVYVISLQLLQQYRRSDPRGSAWIDTSTLQVIALLSSLMYTVHPIQIQSVTYIIQRMNSLATLLYLASFALYIAGRNASSLSQRIVLWLAAAVSWGLSLWSKQITITLPFVIMLYEWMFFHKYTHRRLNRRILMIVGIIVAIMAIVVVIQFRAIGPVFSNYYGRDFTLGERLLTQPRVLIIYAGLTLFPLPSRFNLLHEISTSHSLFDPPTTLFAILVLAGYLYVAFALMKKNRLVSFLLFWPLINLAVESSFLPLEMIFEHRMYLPLLGVTLLLSMLLCWVFSKKWLVWRGVVAFTLIAALCSATYIRNMVWRNPIVLWTDIINKSPTSARAFVNRGGAYADAGDWPRAVADYNHAYALDPKYDKSLVVRGFALFREGKYKDAIAMYREATERTRGDKDVEGIAYRNMGTTYAALGDMDQAVKSYEAAIRAGDTLAFYDRANLYRRKGMEKEALRDYERFRQLDPKSPAAYNNLAALLANASTKELRDVPRAIELATKACELSEWKQWELIETLASVYAADGQFEQAARWQGEAVNVAPREQKLGLERRQQTYQSKAASMSPKRPDSSTKENEETSAKP